MRRPRILAGPRLALAKAMLTSTSSLILLGLLSGAVDLDGLADRLGEPKDKICKAFARLTLDDDRKIPTLEECKAIQTKVGKDCKTHYSVFEQGGKMHCQCNDGSKHSEAILVAKGVDDMLNLANPCYVKCYPTLMRALMKDTSREIRISYKTGKDSNGILIHKKLAEECKPYL